MTDELDELLERCLTARADGHSFGATVAVLEPPARRELEPLVLLADALRRAPRVGLSAAASATNERRLLERAAELRAAYRPTRPAASPAGRWRPINVLTNWRLGLVPAATVFLLVASLVLMGGAGAMVTNARPEDELYNLKLSWEQAQLLIAGTDQQRARAFLAMAQNRLREIELLARDGRPIPPDLLLQVNHYANQAILVSGQVSGREAIPLLRQISELLTYERALLSRFMESLPAPERATVELALQTAEESRQSAEQALHERVEERVPNPVLAPARGASPTPSPTAAPPETVGQPGRIAPAVDLVAWVTAPGVAAAELVAPTPSKSPPTAAPSDEMPAEMPAEIPAEEAHGPTEAELAGVVAEAVAPAETSPTQFQTEVVPPVVVAEQARRASNSARPRESRDKPQGSSQPPTATPAPSATPIPTSTSSTDGATDPTPTPEPPAIPSTPTPGGESGTPGPTATPAPSPTSGGSGTDPPLTPESTAIPPTPLPGGGGTDPNATPEPTASVVVSPTTDGGAPATTPTTPPEPTRAATASPTPNGKRPKPTATPKPSPSPTSVRNRGSAKG